MMTMTPLPGEVWGEEGGGTLFVGMFEKLMGTIARRMCQRVKGRGGTARPPQRVMMILTVQWTTLPRAPPVQVMNIMTMRRGGRQ